MKTLFSAAMIFTALNFFTACSGKTFPTGNYQDKPVTVDGDLSEWDKPIRFVSGGGEVLYNVTNDKDNIYVAIETHDEATALKILRAGINIYIDPSGGQSKDIALAFPMPAAIPAAPEKNANLNNVKPAKKDLGESLLIQATSFNTKGFKHMDNSVYDVSDRSNIKVAIKPAVNNGLDYEAAIPIKNIFENTTSQNSLRTVSVGIVMNAIKSGENYRSRPSGSGGGRHGGGRGGRMGGGGNYQRNNTAPRETTDRTALFKEDANWYKFTLANKA